MLGVGELPVERVAAGRKARGRIHAAPRADAPAVCALPLAVAPRRSKIPAVRLKAGPTDLLGARACAVGEELVGIRTADCVVRVDAVNAARVARSEAAGG